MNKSRNVIYTNKYIPYRSRLYTNDAKDLNVRFPEEKYNKIISDPDDYFTKVKFINFDVINNQCRGDNLQHDREYYKTLFKKNIDSEIVNSLHRDHFVSAARRSERLEKDLQLAHFEVIKLKERLKQKGLYLSSMKKRKKATDDCKTLPF